MTNPTLHIEAVIFDMGGVIMRTGDHAPRTALAERLGLSYAQLASQVFDGPESTRAQTGEITAQAFWEATATSYGLTVQDFIADFFRGDLIDQDLVNELRRLKARYKTALLSNAFSDLRKWVEEWGFTDAFHTMVISAEVKMMKPDPGIYTYILELMNVAPQAAVFVDDLPVNIEAAKTAGMHGILFRSSHQALADLRTLLGEP